MAAQNVPDPKECFAFEISAECCLMATFNPTYFVKSPTFLQKQAVDPTKNKFYAVLLCILLLLLCQLIQS